MKDRDFKMRERWLNKEQERCERLEEKAVKKDLEEKMEWLKEFNKDTIDDSYNDKRAFEEEVNQRLLAFAELKGV